MHVCLPACLGFLVAVATTPIGTVHTASASSLLGRVPRDGALELLEAPRDLVGEGGLALLVVDLPAEEAVAPAGGGGGGGLVLARHGCVVVVVVVVIIVVVGVDDGVEDF